MNGSVTQMTLEAIKQARMNGQSQSDWERIRHHSQRGLEPAEDEDAPDASLLMREVLTKRRVGRPVGSGNKEQVAIRFDRDVIAAFKATGAGWQTRMNAALKDWLKTHQADSLLSSS
jgi:uncharacterized protein (DUF4415 family)